MLTRLTGLVLCLGLALAPLGCAHRPDAPSRAESPAPQNPAQLVAQVFGARAKLTTLDDRAIPGRAPVAFWEVKTDATPTASAVLRVLGGMDEQYSGQGRVLTLRVYLPERRPGDRVVFNFRWNPTGVSRAVTGGGRPSLAARSLVLDIGRGDDVIAFARQDLDLVLGSHVPTVAFAEGVEGRGMLFAPVQKRTGLP